METNSNFINQPEILEVDFGTLLITLFISFLFCAVLTYSLIWVRPKMTDIRDHSKKIQIIYIPGKPPTILFGPQILWEGVPGPEQPVDTAPRELLLIKLTLW